MSTATRKGASSSTRASNAAENDPKSLKIVDPNTITSSMTTIKVIMAYLVTLQEMINKQGKNLRALAMENGTLKVLVVENEHLKKVLEMQTTRLLQLEKEVQECKRSFVEMNALKERLSKIENGYALKEEKMDTMRPDQSTASPDKAVGGLPRFFVEKLPPLQGSTISIEGDEFWHMSKVLRLGADDRVELFDGKGGIVEGVVTAISRNSTHIAAAGDVCHLSPMGPFWHVAAAFGSLKGGRGDWLIEKCTELGAKTVIPLLSTRSPMISDGRNDRWNRVVNGCTQWCRWSHNVATQLQCILTSDFTEEEKEDIIKAGALPVGLGPRRLRVETAAIAMLSAVTLR
ncbi:hypothetical protein L7F22_041668 [Adiantum nelumboides]|nr:hypothetical protein [Adiantum nelumboides]